MKTALVTGASRGIGAAIARELAKSGFSLLVHYNNSKEEAEKLAAETGALECLQADLSKSEEANAMCEAILKKYGGVDLLVNNAGISRFKQFQDITEEMWDRMTDTNLKSNYLVTRALIPAMISKKSGCIINISSMWGVSGASCEAHYSATKAAIIGLTQALAKELGPSGIRVNAVAPGVIKTDMLKFLKEEDLQALAEETPLGRIGTPEDVAKAVAFLASENASFITGEVLNVNGGFLI